MSGVAKHALGIVFHDDHLEFFDAPSTPLGHASQRMAAIHDSPVVLVLSELGHALPTDLVCQL